MGMKYNKLWHNLVIRLLCENVIKTNIYGCHICRIAIRTIFDIQKIRNDFNLFYKCRNVRNFSLLYPANVHIMIV